MKFKRFYHSFRLSLIRSKRKRAKYLKKHDLFDHIGERCYWGPKLLPLYPKLIRLHDNVIIHKTAVIKTHDMLNSFLRKARPDMDFGATERLGCVEIMDNVYVGEKVIILPEVRIGKNCVISAGSVVTADVPENSIMAGNPAKVIGRFDLYCAMRRMNKSQTVKFKNQDLPDELAIQQWERFDKKYSDDKKEQ